jgi:hypothetical protein
MAGGTSISALSEDQHEAGPYQHKRFSSFSGISVPPNLDLKTSEHVFRCLKLYIPKLWSTIKAAHPSNCPL